MKMILAGLVAVALVAGCAGHSTLPANPVPANPGSAASGANPDVGQPGSPSPRWSFIAPVSNFHPNSPVLAADGNIWFLGTEADLKPAISRVTPQGAVTDFPVLPKNAVLTGLTPGPDGNLWFTIVKFHPKPVYIAAGNITPGGAVTEYPLADAQTLDLTGMVGGPDGDLWFARQSIEGIDNEIDKVTTSGHETRYQLQPPSSAASIVAGSDGAMWFADGGAKAIGRITTSGSVSEFPLPGGSIVPTRVVRAGDGNVWFAYFDQSTNVASIGKITPGGSITTYPNPRPETSIDALTVGPDGALWFAESASVRLMNPEELSRITLAGVYDTRDRDIPEKIRFSGGTGLATGADGNLWVTESPMERLAVYAWRRMTVVPSSVTVHAGQSETITTSETNYSGGWTAASSNRAVATVTPGQQSGAFVVHGHATGSCQVTVSDSVGNFYVEPVTVQ